MLDDDELARYEAMQQRAEETPMPRELEEQVADWIVPHTMNSQLKHGEVVIAIEYAYPLIRDYLRAHPEA